MKWLLILFSIFRPFFSSNEAHEMPNPVAELKDLIKKNAVLVMLSFAVVFALASIFAAGIVLIAADIGMQYDRNAVVYFSATSLTGIILMLVPVIVGFSLIKKYDNNEEQVAKNSVFKNANPAHPLQDALTLLIQDFVKEREMKRTQHHPTQTPTDSRVPTAEDFMH